MARVAALLVTGLVTLAAGASACTSSGGGPPGVGAPSGSADGSSPSAAATAYALEPSCPRVQEPQVVSANQVNEIVSAADLPGWQAGDIGASARLSDGRLVWVFGDTVRQEGVEPRIVANSMLVSSGTCISQVVTPQDGPVIPDVAEGEVRWPMSIAVLPPVEKYADQGATDVLLVLAARTKRNTGGQSMDYEFRGTSAAVFAVGRTGAPQLREVRELTPEEGDLDQVNWGAASTRQGPWLYVYGTRLPDTTGSFGRELYVGRVPVDDPGDTEQWRFWDGSSWRASRGSAQPVLPAVGGVSQTLSVSVVAGRFVAVSKRDGDLGDFVYTWTSSKPFGPWTAQQGVSAPAGYDSGELEYAPLAHPEIRLASGRLLVSISRNTTDFNQLLADPEVGRPVFAEVDRP